MSALGSGGACPATVIAFCPSCQLVARPWSVRRGGGGGRGGYPPPLLLLRCTAVLTHPWLWPTRRWSPQEDDPVRVWQSDINTSRWARPSPAHPRLRNQSTTAPGGPRGSHGGWPAHGAGAVGLCRRWGRLGRQPLKTISDGAAHGNAAWAARASLHSSPPNLGLRHGAGQVKV